MARDGNHMRRTMHGTMRHPAPLERVFPLLCPVREREWLQGWDATMVCSESGVAEPGCVFTTVGPKGALDGMNDGQHRRRLAHMEASINHFLETGSMLRG